MTTYPAQTDEYAQRSLLAPPDGHPADRPTPGLAGAVALDWVRHPHP